MKDKKSIIIFPEKESENNFYLYKISKMLEKKYKVYGYKDLKKNIKELFNKDIIILNWYENVNECNLMNLIVKYIKKAFFILLLKLTKTKIIWTVHNHKPHDIKDDKINTIFYKYMAFMANTIHVLCKNTINEKFLKKYQYKIKIAHHGDYINCYKCNNCNIYEKYNIPKQKKIMLFIGQIRKYKNIELLIEAFKESKLENENFILLICGNCSSEKYKEELLQKLENMENVFFDFHFIKDEEMADYLETTKVLVAPYNKKSSLNSGTLWMCMSYKKTMILPEIGCVKDINNREDFLYTYDYSGEDEHYTKLLECFNRLKKDIKDDEKILEKKGDLAYKYIHDNQTWEKLENEWISMIES